MTKNKKDRRSHENLVTTNEILNDANRLQSPCDVRNVLATCKNQEDFETNWYRLPQNAVVKVGDIFSQILPDNTIVLKYVTGSIGRTVDEYPRLYNFHRRRTIFAQQARDEQEKRYDFSAVRDLCKDKEDFKSNWYRLPWNAVPTDKDICLKNDYMFTFAKDELVFDYCNRFKFFRRREDTFTEKKKNRPIFKPTAPEPFEPKIGQIVKYIVKAITIYKTDSLGYPKATKDKDKEILFKIEGIDDYMVNSIMVYGKEVDGSSVRVLMKDVLRATQKEVDKFLFDFQVNRFDKIIERMLDNNPNNCSFINPKHIVKIASFGDDCLGGIKIIMARTKDGEVGIVSSFYSGIPGCKIEYGREYKWRYVGFGKNEARKLETFLTETSGVFLKEPLKIHHVE